MTKQYLEEKNVPTNPELWSRAKALARQKFDVYPSAYANGWASKWYKSKGGGWKSKVDEACWEGYKQAGMKKKGSKMVPNCVPVEEEKQGHALVVNNKIVARDAKHRLVSLAKEKHGGLKNNEVFLAYTGKSVGDKWRSEEHHV